MKIFQYTGSDEKGRPRTGTISAEHYTLATLLLERQGIQVLQLKEKAGYWWKRRPKKADIINFTRQLAIMIKSNIPIIDSLDLLRKSYPNPNLQDLLLQLKIDLETGGTLSKALRKHPDCFDNLYCNLIAAGEQSGKLDVLLSQLADYLEKSQMMIGKVKKALVYPVSVLMIALTVSIILLVYVIPTFEDMFKNMDVPLPSITRNILSVSRFLRKNSTFLTMTFIAAIVLWQWYWRRSTQMRYIVQRSLLKFPIIGSILKQSILARINRTCSTLLMAGIPLIDVLETCKGVANHLYYIELIENLKLKMVSGQSFSAALEATQGFPSLMIYLIKTGEETGNLDQLCGRIAVIYEEEVDGAVSTLNSLMEPIMISIVGILVGGLVAAMYLPIFSIGKLV